MARIGTPRTCPKGHVFVKTSDCPTCPQCETARAPHHGWMAKLAAPARRALERTGITSLKELADRSEQDLLALHGFGPSSLPILRNELKAAGLQFQPTTKHMRDLPKKPTNTDEYIALLPVDQQDALKKVRAQIRSAAPKAVEHFGYGLPGFKYNGHPLLYFGAAKEHCALYGAVPKGFTEQLKDFEVSKGTIRFTPLKPFPVGLVKAIVKARMLENDARWPMKNKTTKSKRP